LIVREREQERERERESERDRVREIKHLSVHQWLRPAIPDSQQPASPIGFLFLKLPPPPCAVLLVTYIYIILFCGYAGHPHPSLILLRGQGEILGLLLLVGSGLHASDPAARSRFNPTIRYWKSWGDGVIGFTLW